MTNKEIREEMMIQIEQLKTIEILNRLGMHNKDEVQTKADIKYRIEELYQQLLEDEP
ncbi:hypothetical protein [Enterocloster bolteae]|uniref:hypothetical protein n=1 Tax=Enterocloster bolteae TaxID=208479 RepID=UPI0028DC2F79|nr:hypothetical protein [Enterocloster bolteae]